MREVLLDGKDLPLKKAIEISKGAPIALCLTVRKKIEESRELVKNLAYDDQPYYGINTGFGYLANKKISKEDLHHLQHNIITSHASGWGEPIGIPETRLSMALRLNVLVKGYTGVRFELCTALQNLINAEVYPIIPKYGSVGASGDLAPLAHLALPLIGRGNVLYKGKKMSALEALELAGLKPISLVEKEGLSLVNGTQVMLGIGSIALQKALNLVEHAEIITALTYEALDGHLAPLQPQLHEVRLQIGQITSAKKILKALEGSYLHDTSIPRSRVQDPYSMRCAPQVHGASRDALNYSKTIIERELNAVTDNPLVFTEEGAVISGGNFHGQPLAFAFDIASMAMAEIANISERRLELLLNPNTNKLSPFLTTDPGVDSGHMAAQYLCASLVNENKLLANPACTDSIPGNVGIEDHVSMGMTSARKFQSIVENTITVLSAEALSAVQAIDLGKKTKLGKETQILYSSIRSHIPPWAPERILANDIEKARSVLETCIQLSI